MPVRKKIDNIVIGNAQILFRNFSGKPSKYNQEGKRNFCVYIDDPALLNRLNAEGWNVKESKTRYDDEEPRYYIRVNVSYSNIPPKVYLVTSKNKTLLTEETINQLDYAEINNVDLTIRPYIWETQDKSGVSGYLRTMYVTIEEDEFESKYAEEEHPEEEEFLPF